MNPWRLRSSTALQGNRTDRVPYRRKPKQLPNTHPNPALPQNPRVRSRLPGPNRLPRFRRQRRVRLPRRLLHLRLLDRRRCGRPWLPDNRLSRRLRHAVFRFRPGPLRRPPGQVRFFPVRASRCRAFLRKPELTTRRRRRLRGPHTRRRPLRESSPACRRLCVPLHGPLLLRLRPSCRELPWAEEVLFGRLRNRTLPDSRPPGRSSRRVRI
jgi:hypothetical protein